MSFQRHFTEEGEVKGQVYSDSIIGIVAIFSGRGLKSVISVRIIITPEGK